MISDNGTGKPKMKDRHNILLWQTYLHWDELTKLKQRHLGRISAIERGDSKMDAGTEHLFIEAMNYDRLIGDAKKTMELRGQDAGPIWDWLLDIKGLGSKYLAARLVALIDWPGKFATVSKLWRFSGLAVIDGKAEPKSSEHYNRRLKSLLLGERQIVPQFITHHAFPYADLYYESKAYERQKHPETLCVQCGVLWDDCQSKKAHKRQFNDGHLHMRAMRKTAKVFLQHVWVKWREFEGLPISEPYAQAILKHTHIIEPA